MTLPFPTRHSADLPTEPEQRFVLRQVVFKGATMVDQAELDALAADYIGRQVAFDDLQQIAQRVTDLYLRRGYYLAQAVLPVQEVVDGVVRSEEHTSELQSLMRISYAVFCLKKKNKKLP